MNEEEIAKCDEFIRTIRDEDCYTPSFVYWSLIDYYDAMRPTITYAGLIEHLIEATQENCREMYT